MKLRNISLDDLSLYESLLCDPHMMSHLGGAFPRERMPQKLRRDVESVETERAWIFKIIPDESSSQAAGSVCIWDNALHEETITEIGWMVLPQFQGRGVGSAAVSAILDKARSEKRWHVIHAFPSVTNAASNAICRKMGFALLEETDLDYAGRMLRCNHWRLNLLPEPKPLEASTIKSSETLKQ
jgi:RimJ/RimL family protein N-acetyltransferase